MSCRQAEEKEKKKIRIFSGKNQNLLNKKNVYVFARVRFGLIAVILTQLQLQLQIAPYKTPPTCATV